MIQIEIEKIRLYGGKENFAARKRFFWFYLHPLSCITKHYYYTPTCPPLYHPNLHLLSIPLSRLLLNMTSPEKTVDWKPQPIARSTTILFFSPYRITAIVITIVLIITGILLGIFKPWLQTSNKGDIFTPSADTLAIRAHVESQLRSSLYKCNLYTWYTRF